MIEKYLDGNMDEKEKITFEEKLRNDDQLRKDVMFHAEVNESISDIDKDRLRQKIRKIIEGDTVNQFSATANRQKTTRLFLSRSILIAASLLFLFSIGSILFILNTKTYTPNEIFEYYYQPYTPDVVTRSSGVDDMLNPALDVYLKGEYENATERFNDLLTANPDDSMALFYAAIAYIETGEYQKAIDHFKYIINNEYYPYFYHAQWYLGLTYLKLEETDKALHQFNTIIDQNKYYADRASDVLSRLN
jgi:tetratricopeptide (TPR) repeat protein